MNARAELEAVLARYDDDAWVALANRGLLRRAHKDLETLDIRLAGETDTHVEVAVGDKVVRFGAAGPAEAMCSCPSVVICQHVITAGLWLAASSDRTAAEPTASAVDRRPARRADGARRDDAHLVRRAAGVPLVPPVPRRRRRTSSGRPRGLPHDRLRASDPDRPLPRRRTRRSGARPAGLAARALPGRGRARLAACPRSGAAPASCSAEVRQSGERVGTVADRVACAPPRLGRGPAPRHGRRRRLAPVSRDP